MEEFLNINSSWGLVYGITLGVLASVSLFMLLFSIHAFLEKKNSSAIIFFYCSLATFLFTCFDIYIIDFYDPAVIQSVPDWLLTTGKLAIPICIIFNYRTFVVSLQIQSLEEYLAWNEAKETILIFDILMLLCVLCLLFIRDPNVVLCVSFAAIIVQNIFSIKILNSLPHIDQLKKLYKIVLYTIMTVAISLITLVSLYGLTSLSESTFINFHLFFATTVVVYGFLLIQHNLPENKSHENTSKLIADGFFKNIYDALCHDEFFILYQPKIILETGKICGVEALIRWNHRSKGMISPDEFIPAAEQTTIINNICEWLIINTTKDIKKLRERGITIPVSINFSVVNINLQTVRFLIKTLKDNDLPNSCIIVEITESLFLDMNSQQLQSIEELKQAAIKLSLDDFGAGHSSLQYLNKLPLGEVKIDRALIDNMTDNTQKAVVHALMEMCHILDIEVVAEGVNDDRTMEDLLAMKCEMGQGYGICRPKPLEEVIDWALYNLTDTTPPK